MDSERRTHIAALGRALLPELEAAVIDSWGDLMPVAAEWSPESWRRAKAAARAALEGIIGVFEQGDLDDRSWAEARDVVLGHGHATVDEASELLRTVRIVAIERLAERLEESLALSNDERWQLQEEAHAFCQQVLNIREEPDPGVLDHLLDELERSGPDLR